MSRWRRISLGTGKCKPTSDVGLIDEEKLQSRIQSGDNKQSINCGIKSRAKEEKIMKTDNLKELRELRNQEKAIKARIDEISTEATNEAVAI